MNDSSSFLCVSTSHSIVHSNYFFVFFFLLLLPRYSAANQTILFPFFPNRRTHYPDRDEPAHRHAIGIQLSFCDGDPGDRCCFCYIISTYYIVFCLWFFTSFVPLSLLGFCWFRSTHHNYAEVCDDNSLERRNWRPSGSSALWLASCPVTCYRLTNPPTWFSCPMFPCSPSKKKEKEKKKKRGGSKNNKRRNDKKKKLGRKS